MEDIQLRDYIAAQIASGDHANGDCFNYNSQKEDLMSAARYYYRMADAMLDAREEI